MPELIATEAVLKTVVIDEIQKAWTLLAQEFSATGDYVRGITAAGSVQYDVDGDPLSVAVENLAPHAVYVDDGHSGFHLPSHIKKWKTTKTGKRIVTVPFRHFTPNAAAGGPSVRATRAMMPPKLYESAKGGQSSFPVPRQAPYTRGQRSKSYVYYRAQGWPGVPQAQGYTWKAGKYENLQATRFRTPGGGWQSGYMTFRTITPESEGWYIPPLPGKHLPERVIEVIEPVIAKEIADAVSRDLQEHWVAVMRAGGSISIMAEGDHG